MFALALLAAFMLVGCFDAGTTLPRWQLQVVGDPQVTSVELPRHLDLPDRPCTYVLSTRFDVFRRSENLGEFVVKMPGAHNVLNALAVIAVADELEIPLNVTRDAIASFHGVQRRFTVVGQPTITRAQLSLDTSLQRQRQQLDSRRTNIPTAARADLLRPPARLFIHLKSQREESFDTLFIRSRLAQHRPSMGM